MLFGSAADGFELFISLRRFDDIPDMYASLNGRCGLCRYVRSSNKSEKKKSENVQQNKNRIVYGDCLITCLDNSLVGVGVRCHVL